MSSIDNGGKTSCYDVPKDAETLNDLIEHKDMRFWRGEAFKALYAIDERASRSDNASEGRELNKVIYYAKRRLEVIKNA